MSTLVGLMGGPVMFICASRRTDTAASIADEVLAVHLALGTSPLASKKHRNVIIQVVLYLHV
jgi:hypothetical protein